MKCRPRPDDGSDEMTTPPPLPRYQPYSAPRATWPGALADRAALRMAGLLIRGVDGALSAVHRHDADALFPSLAHLSSSIRDTLVSHGWPAMPLRIGVKSPGPWCKPLFDQASPLPVQWWSLGADAHAAQACRVHALDAIVERCGDTGLLVHTLERTDHEALWADWTQERPVSFPAVFPARLDVSSLQWHEVGEDEWTLAHDLIIAAATLARDPARATMADLLRGRHGGSGCFDPASHATGLKPLATQRPWRETALWQAASSLIAAGSFPSPVRVAAARLCGAAATLTDWPVTESFRLATAQAAAAVLREDPTSLLRLAAVQLGCTCDEEGLATLERAHDAVDGASGEESLDNIGFLQAEAVTGEPVSLTTGRLAAGMSIAFAHSPASRIRFILEDFLDVLGESGRLVGRDQDLALLKRAFGVLDRAATRAAARRPLPAPSPAAAPNATTGSDSAGSLPSAPATETRQAA